MSDTLECKARQELGTSATRRLRKSGWVPINLYGHGEGNQNLMVSAEQIDGVMRHGSRVVELIGDASGNALIREVQWDYAGVDVLHLDMTRVSAQERVEVAVSVELRGEAPGSKEGGKVDVNIHELMVECPALEIPDHIEVNINELHLDDVIYVKDLQVPEGLTVLADPDTQVVGCSAVIEQEEEAAAETGPAEPELIGRPEADENESED